MTSASLPSAVARPFPSPQIPISGADKMKLLVCVKQVPDLESRFVPNAEGVWYNETDLAWR